MNTVLDIDSDTLKMLSFLYEYRKTGCSVKEFLEEFGIESSATLLEFTKLGYIAFSSEGHSVNEFVFDSYIDNRLRLSKPFISKSDIIFCMPKGNKIVESHSRSFWFSVVPLVVSILSLFISMATLYFSISDNSPVRVEIVSPAVEEPAQQYWSAP